ncbi:MAG: response regulator [Cyanobacteria bacterium P01_H01_bin.15]
MDSEQQYRLNFLEEAQTYCDRMEQSVLGSSQWLDDFERLDSALRSAHSIKGAAAMMDFAPLSSISHRLEDFLKILRVRQDPNLLDETIETALLQGIDCLREVGLRLQNGDLVTDDWLAQRTAPIFQPLQNRLGELTQADEDRLLAQEESVDVSALVFAGGVGDCLEDFSAKLKGEPAAALQSDLQTTAQQLAEFGRMAQLEAFVSLCDSVEQQLSTIPEKGVLPFAELALEMWQRSHSLVSLGRNDDLPRALQLPADFFEQLPASAETPSETAEAAFADLDDMAMGDLDSLMGSMDTEALASMFGDLEDPVLEPMLPLSETPPLSVASSVENSGPNPEEPLPTEPVTADQRVSDTVRVSAADLRRINILFGQLILERNSVTLRQGQLQRLVALMQRRMGQLEKSHRQLRQWYDRAALEGLFPSAQAAVPSIAPQLSAETAYNFDILEMDRYGDLHLQSQEQMETIVQLQEVSADIELTLGSLEQATTELDSTTRSLQRSISRTQMRPFADIVSRFPRVIRDLSVQYGKQIALKIRGEQVLIDRLALDVLSDPLNHLLRNAFDHGIGTPETRLAAGKPAEGTITLEARHQGNQSVITVSDDGQGIALAKVRDRVCQMGFKRNDVEKLTQSELLNFIFEPGFSTAEAVTELSGRGVGMDVVRTNLQQVGGNVVVESQPGRGTTFTLTIPLTLSVLRVMVVESNGLVFAVPANVTAQVLPLEPGHNDDSFSINNRIVPLVHLNKYLTFQRAFPAFEMPEDPVVERPSALAIAQSDYQRGIYIERFWGEQEVTVRTIASPIMLPPGFSSATVLGDGRVIPVIDPLALLKWIDEMDQMSASRETSTEDLSLDPWENNSDTDQNLILVVDDSVHIRRYMTAALEKAGYRVEQAKDGQDAVNKIFSELPIQAVICDIEMPQLDGYGVLAKVKAHPTYQSLPIVMLTSRSNQKHRKLALNLGADDYFSKPYNEQELLQTLSQLINQQTPSTASLSTS